MYGTGYLAASALTITPVSGPLSGKAMPPGSKSITNRALLLAALAKGRSHITGALKSDDTRLMADALRAMGVPVEEPDVTTFVVDSNGHLQSPGKPLFLGNAGTATRFLAAAVALVNGEVVLDGDEHMRKRPIGPLVVALRSMGVDAESIGGCPPVTVHGTGGFRGGRVEIDGALSSQYVSAVLMMAPLASGPVEIALTGPQIGARGYVDLTLSSMRAFGVEVEHVSIAQWRVEPGAYRATDYHVEPDASAATYLWAAEALTGGSIDLGVAAHAFTQPDARAYGVISKFPRMPSVIEGSQMQDAIPTLAVLAAYNQTQVRFTGIANLRVKECDRIHALAQGLNRIRRGLAEEEGDDLIVHGNPKLAGAHVDARIDSFADHRIAMSFALAGLKTTGITILDPRCVAKTFPGYWDTLAALGVELRVADENLETSP
ncbi:3-phosphoshikimate 1-carboxyvinyltransferase [Oricola nitratireducens]|uniref:3-phosphoshikimate 1-carboxyvinyltransferase n=1 Tax=Oricola nitratireducens TaxID=2775868 RepID=UPI0018696683|nr:3-phosphoshikimate 1-carboxyvinyltransferase [Oricola nitratireducens]